MTETNPKRSLVVSSLHDPAAIAVLAQFYENAGVLLRGNYSELIQVLIEETLIAHKLRVDTVEPERAILLLAGMGFSTRQLDSKKGLRRLARHEQVEAIADSRAPEVGLPLPESLQAKIDGLDPSPYTQESREEEG